MLTCVRGSSPSAKIGLRYFSAKICALVLNSFVFLSIGTVPYGHAIFVLYVALLPVLFVESCGENDGFIFSKE